MQVEQELLDLHLSLIKELCVNLVTYQKTEFVFARLVLLANYKKLSGSAHYVYRIYLN